MLFGVRSFSEDVYTYASGGNCFRITMALARSADFIQKTGFGFGVDETHPATSRAAWNTTVDADGQYNEPGVFWAFIAYE